MTLEQKLNELDTYYKALDEKYGRNLSHFEQLQIAVQMMQVGNDGKEISKLNDYLVKKLG